MADLKEEITTLKCGPCFFDGDSVEPKHFCVDCLDYLCTGCAREHRRYKLSREHTVLEDSEFPPDVKLFEEMKKLSYCHKHLNIEVDKYCPNHDELICMYCLQTDHMSCEGLSDLTDLIEDSMRIKPEERFHDLQINCKEKQNEIMPHLDEALVDINKVNKEIHDFIHILKENVDQIEKKLNQKLKTSAQRVRQFEEKLSKLETKTSFYENLHIITSKYGTEKHRIVFNFTLCALRKELEADDSLKSVSKEKIQFKQPTKVEDQLAMLRQFDVVPLCKDEQASDEFSSDEESLYEDAMEFLEPKTRDEATQYEIVLKMTSTEKPKVGSKNKKDTKDKGIKKVKPAIDEIFDQIDQNHDGRVSVHELKKAARLLGLNPTLKEAEQMIEDCNPREKGYVSRAEFRKLFESKERDMGMQLEQITAAFKVFDKDNSGTLTRDEILAVMRLAGDKMDDTELDHMLSRVDVNGDGKISIDEFAALVCGT